MPFQDKGFGWGGGGGGSHLNIEDVKLGLGWFRLCFRMSVEQFVRSHRHPSFVRSVKQTSATDATSVSHNHRD